MKRTIPFLLGILILSGTSCKNDIDINAKWKEITVVYGLLNQNDTAQYIKINKAYLGNGNAYQMAKIYDSTNYHSNQLSVLLERWRNGSLIENNVLQKDNSIAKPAGLFANDSNILYKTKVPLFDDSQYLLVVKNNATGNTVRSSTTLVSDFDIINPRASNKINFALAPQQVFKIQWNSSPNGRIYECTVRFHYTEQDIATSKVTSYSVDWVLPNQETLGLGGGEAMEVDVLGANFYRLLATRIAVNSSVKRSAGNLDFIFTAGGDDLNTYIAVNQPSYGIIQEKPQFTNIQNGLGIFSARLNKTLLNLSLTSNSLDSLYGGAFTYNLGFCDPSPISPYYCN